MSISPRISVITPTKDRLSLLRKTMDSVAAQSFRDWEHIVVDDGSSDGTAEEVSARAKADPRVRFLSRPEGRGGANPCRNLGLRESRSELVVFLDSDDLLRPDCLERRFEAMERNQDLHFAVFPADVFVDRPGDLGRPFHDMAPGDDLLRFFCLECVWEITGPVWRRPFLLELGGFDEALPSMQDVDLHVRAIARRGRYVFFDRPDHDIRWQPDYSKVSVRHFHDPQAIAATRVIPERLMEAVRAAGLVRWSLKRAALGRHFQTSESLARAGMVREALRGWRLACRDAKAPWHVLWGGTGMLFLAKRAGKEGSLSYRIVNRWRGLARFRAEPALVSERVR